MRLTTILLVAGLMALLLGLADQAGVARAALLCQSLKKPVVKIRADACHGNEAPVGLTDQSAPTAVGLLDTLRSVDGRVYRNDIPVPDDQIPEDFRSHDTWGPRFIPEGYYFVMGDHRNNSSDSRTWDYVPMKYIIGKVQVRWWPVNHAKVF